MRAFITNDPYLALDEGRGWTQRGVWPCKWICFKDAGDPPFVTAYRKKFSMDNDATMRVHVSADERYELFLDGERIGRGSERGDRNNWFYETYDINLTKGDHLLVARVWSLGSKSPFAQLTVYPGFIFSPEGEFIEKLGTGVAEWEAKVLDGYEFVDPFPAWGSGWNLIVHGDQFDWGFECDEDDGWGPVIERDNGANGFIRNEYPAIHLMKPATLPEQVDSPVCTGVVRFVSDKREDRVSMADDIAAEHKQWNLLKSKDGVSIPANTTRRVIIDLEQYYCVYPELVTSGGKGSSVQINWEEAPYENFDGFGVKGNRNEIDGKIFRTVGDTFLSDGGNSRRFDTLWWQAGRYMELVIKTADEPLMIESLKLRETRYPLEMESTFKFSDPRFASFAPIALRGLQMCSHETYLDCPFYEQLQYAGDTRLEILATLAITRDDRLPRKALRMFDQSRHISGVSESRYPSRVTQVIPPFSLWWIGTVHDYSLWRNDPEFVESLMPGVRAIIDFYLSFRNDDGLIEAPNGWNFMDWVPAWPDGMPPDGDKSVSGLINWQLVYALKMVEELELDHCRGGFAEQWGCARGGLAHLARRSFWDEERGLLADDLEHKHFSEHTQCMALLSGFFDDDYRGERIAHGLLNDPDLSRTTISFTHYLFETYRMLGRMDKLFERLGLWFELEKLGFKTTLEMPEPSRSDCHGWGAHPLYHCFASILGIRPSSPGFATVSIEPQLGPLTSAKGTLVHPKGEIEVDFRLEDGKLKGLISLPNGVTGTLKYGRTTVELEPGWQDIEC